jgi:predicted RNase H-like HicB family nuclease
MLDLKYSLIVEATKDPNIFGFYSPDLEGFTGIGHSIEDCIYKAGWGMEEHIELLRERDLSVPLMNKHATVTIQNEQQNRSAALL